MLKFTYDSLDDVPKQFHELYTEKDGKFILTGISGIKPEEDINRLNEALRKERKDHKETKDKFSKFGDKDPEEILSLLDKIPELEAAAKGKLDDEKINQLVEARIKSKTAPLERELENLKKEASNFKTENEVLKTERKQRIIHDEVRKAATELKIVETAVEDVLYLSERLFEVSEEGKVLAKDGVGVTPGIDAKGWLGDMQEKRPHWWPPSAGGGAKGSGGAAGFANNPFTKEHWNLSEQGRIYKENPSRAEQMAKSAGTKIGGKKPT